MATKRLLIFVRRTSLSPSPLHCLVQDSGRNPSVKKWHTRWTSMWTRPPKSRWTWWREWVTTTSTGMLTTTPPSSCCPTRATPPWWSSCPTRARCRRWRATSTRTTSGTGETLSPCRKRNLCFFNPYPLMIEKMLAWLDVFDLLERTSRVHDKHSLT